MRTRRKNPSSACRVSPQTRATLEREHVALHEGLPTKSITCEPMEALPSKPTPFGTASEIQYEKAIPGDAPDYHHPWKFYAQPTIGVDAKGKLHFASGRYEVRKRGIEDRVPAGRKGSSYLVVKHVRPERWLKKAPARLVVLGKLKFVRYTPMGQSGPRAKRTLRFAPGTGPTIAHDQDGNLHALGGSYRIPATGASSMARRRHRSSRRRNSAYANPSHSMTRRRSGRSYGAKLEASGMLALTGLGVLAVAVPTAVLLDGALARTSWSAPVKAFTKLAVGLGGFGVISTFMPQQSKVRPALALGVLAGAGTDAGLDLYNLYAAPFIAQITAPAPATNTAVVQTPAGPVVVQTPAGPVSGAAQALMPGRGAPSQYRAYNPQMCAA